MFFTKASPTDGQTDRRADRPCCRDVRTHLKSIEPLNAFHYVMDFKNALDQGRSLGEMICGAAHAFPS